MSLEWISVVVPVLVAVLMGVIGMAVTQSLGRLNDRIVSLQRELDEHKRDDHENFKYQGNLLHWIATSLQRIILRLAIEGKEIDIPERPER